MREWGTELWDQLERVDAKFVALSTKNDHLVRFLREKAQLDQEYCTKLRKLSNKFEKLAQQQLSANKDTKFTTENAFTQLLSGKLFSKISINDDLTWP